MMFDQPTGTFMARRAFGFLAVLLAGLTLTGAPAAAQERIAFVVGNGAYTKEPLDIALNDAGLVAEALRTAGFEIVEGADVDQSNFRQLFREFLSKVEAAGPEAIAFVYFSGYGLEFDGGNYLVPVDAQLARVSDIPIDAVRLSDLTRPLAGTQARAKIVVIDAARALPFAFEGDGLAPGLAALEATPGLLVAFSSAPATVAEDRKETYGAYASALAEMIQEPGIDIDTMFTGIRSRTHQVTEGKQTPWHANGIDSPLVLLEADQGSADADAATEPVAKRAVRPMRELDAEEAYALAIELDTLEAYVEFVEAHPTHALAPRVWAIIRARREALAWQAAVEINTAEAYWTYLTRYPDGVYAADARRRLSQLAAAAEPPANFAPVPFADVPPPLPGEPASFFFSDYPWVAPPIILIRPPRAIFVRLPPVVRVRRGVLPRPRHDWPRHRPVRPRGPDRPIQTPIVRQPGGAVRPGHPGVGVRPLPAPRDPPVQARPGRPDRQDRPVHTEPGRVPGVVRPAQPAPVVRPSAPPATIARPTPPAVVRPPAAVNRPAVIDRRPPPVVQRPPPVRVAPPAVVNRPPVINRPAVVRPAPVIQRQPPMARPAAPQRQQCRGRGCG